MNVDKKPYHVLILEDNPGDFFIVAELLAETIADVSIIHADSFERATAYLSAQVNAFDIILLDLTLPDKSGEHLVTEMLEASLCCPIIILTGRSDIDFSIMSISMGISDYLIKDELTPPMLYKSIVYSIERKRAISNLQESEKRYSDLFHLSPQPMWVCDPNTLHFLDVNIAAIKDYGYSRDEFLLMAIDEIVSQEDIFKVLERNRDSGEADQQGIWINQKKTLRSASRSTLIQSCSLAKKRS